MNIPNLYFNYDCTNWYRQGPIRPKPWLILTGTECHVSCKQTVKMICQVHYYSFACYHPTFQNLKFHLERNRMHHDHDFAFQAYSHAKKNCQPREGLLPMGLTFPSSPLLTCLPTLYCSPLSTPGGCLSLFYSHCISETKDKLICCVELFIIVFSKNWPSGPMLSISRNVRVSGRVCVHFWGTV